MANSSATGGQLLAYRVPEDWDGTSWPGLLFDTIEFQPTAATGGPWTPQRSLDGTNWDACSVWNETTPYTSLTTGEVGKIFTVSGRGYFRLNPTSGGDIITAQIRAS